MYGMDENKTSATGRVVSFGANYSNGPLALGLAFTGQKNLVGGDGVNPVNLRTYGLGANYKLNPMMLIGNFTRTSNSVNDAAAWQVSFGVFYPLDNAWSVGAMLTHEKGNDVLENAKANQFAAIVNYAFSKRTQVYLTGSVQKASSGANAQMTGTFADGDLPAAGASSGRSQSMVRVGMRHFF
jgi:predicted porin